MLGDLTGLTSVDVRVVVGGQSSNTLVVPVRPPRIDSLDVYDVELLVSGWRRSVSCSNCAWPYERGDCVEF